MSFVLPMHKTTPGARQAPAWGPKPRRRRGTRALGVQRPAHPRTLPPRTRPGRWSACGCARRPPAAPRRSPSTTAATVESSSQLFFRKRLWSHPFLASFFMAGGRAWSRRGGRCSARCSEVRVGAGGGPGAAGVPRRSGGGTRRRRGEGVRCRLPPPLSLTLSPPPPPPPPEIARRAWSSVNMRGGRARLLLPPRRRAARVPTSEKGGRSGRARRRAVRVWRPRSRWNKRGSAPCARLEPRSCSGNLRPAFSRNVSPFFFFLNGQARFSHLGFPPLRNPQREEPLTPLLWPLPCTPLPVPFLHTSHYQHITGERGALLGRRSWGGN